MIRLAPSSLACRVARTDGVMSCLSPRLMNTAWTWSSDSSWSASRSVTSAITASYSTFFRLSTRSRSASTPVTRQPFLHSRVASAAPNVPSPRTMKCFFSGMVVYPINGSSGAYSIRVSRSPRDRATITEIGPSRR